jgi:hypothetical protein
MGIKSFAGNIDGNEINTASIFVVVPLDDTRGTAKGYASQEYKVGDASVFQQVKHLPFPHQADIEKEEVTNGKGGTKIVVRSYTPVTQQNVSDAAKKVQGA